VIQAPISENILISKLIIINTTLIFKIFVKYLNLKDKSRYTFEHKFDYYRLKPELDPSTADEDESNEAKGTLSSEFIGAKTQPLSHQLRNSSL